jgi:outer membrane biosynthesis protein TonB
MDIFKAFITCSVHTDPLEADVAKDPKQDMKAQALEEQKALAKAQHKYEEKKKAVAEHKAKAKADYKASAKAEHKDKAKAEHKAKAKDEQKDKAKTEYKMVNKEKAQRDALAAHKSADAPSAIAAMPRQLYPASPEHRCSAGYLPRISKCGVGGRRAALFVSARFVTPRRITRRDDVAWRPRPRFPARHREQSPAHYPARGRPSGPSGRFPWPDKPRVRAA